MNETEILKEVKTLIGLKDEDNKQDSLLNVLISNTASQFKIILGETIIPAELYFIWSNVVVSRYNRLGQEGMVSYSQEGEGFRFQTSDFEPYMTLIDKFTGDDGHGKVVFFT